MLLTDDPRIYVRVYDSVKNDIVTGHLAPGKPVPRSRTCASNTGEAARP